RLRITQTLPKCRSGWGMPTLPRRGSMIGGRAGRRKVRRLRWSVECTKEKSQNIECSLNREYAQCLEYLDWGRGNMISMQQLQSLTIEKLVSEIYKVNPNFDAELSPCFPSPVGGICVITYPSSNRAPTARFRSGSNKTIDEAIAEIIGPHVESNRRALTALELCQTFDQSLIYEVVIPALNERGEETAERWHIDAVIRVRLT